MDDDHDDVIMVLEDTEVEPKSSIIGVEDLVSIQNCINMPQFVESIATIPTVIYTAKNISTVTVFPTLEWGNQHCTV